MTQDTDQILVLLKREIKDQKSFKHLHDCQHYNKISVSLHEYVFE